MRHCVIAFFAFLLGIPASAQFGNEWINYNQAYFKIPVGKDGIYRLTQSSLLAAGLPGSVDPKTLRLYHRGIEQAIYVAGENDGILNSTDFIEFYGRHNDGTLDTQLYKTPASQPHTHYNLYSDTTSYFLTFGEGTGKRMTALSESSAGLTAEPFHFDKKLLVLKSDYSSGIDYGDVKNTIFDAGEGWMGNQIPQSQTGSYLIDGITNKVTTASKPILELLLTGRGPMSHAVEISAGSRLLTTVTFLDYQSYKLVQTLEWSDIGNDGKITINVKVVGSNGQPDRVSVGYIQVQYAQSPDMESISQKEFTLPATTIGKSYLEISNSPAGTRLFDITDPLNVSRITSSQPSTLNAVIPFTNSERKVLAVSTTLAPSINLVSFRAINPAAHNYIIITHPLLRKPAGGYTDPVKAYAEYRSLPQGGGYDTLVININQLYDQFNYGEQSPLGIFHFMKFLSSVKLPQYLFLVGKGLDVNYRYYRDPGSFTTYKDLVPTAGYPASDMAFTAGLSGIPHVAAVATGRLTAMGPQDVAAYFDKVKELEAMPFDDLRRKNILHLSGGLYEGEPQLFRSYLQEFASVAKTFNLGGHVTAVAKKTTASDEVVNVAAEVNKGLSLITFFGHSQPLATDFDIGNVTDPVMGYNNKGKYPVMLINGCLSGSFFLNATIFGENWINTPNRGAIAVIAHSSLGFAYTLKRFSSFFYQIGFGDAGYINKGIGDVQKEIAKRYLTEYGLAQINITQVQQMVLLGDPAVKLFGAGKPDYEINKESVTLESFSGGKLTALLDSFNLKFIVRNFGTAINKPLKVQVTRTSSDNSVAVYDSLYKPVLYSDTLSFVIPQKKGRGFGNNTFSIKIDANNLVDELKEDNNVVLYDHFIPLSATKNLYPDNYSIVNSSTIFLSFQHTDMLSSEREFILEIDTTAGFNSTFKKSFAIKGTVLATQLVGLLQKDTLAYYWRSKLANPLSTESAEWDNSTFTFINNGPKGWAQVDFPQFSDNPASHLVKDPLLKRIRFDETVTSIAIKTFGAAAGKPVDSVSFKIGGAEYNTGTEFPCRNNTINLIAFDKKTTQPYLGIYLTWFDLFYTYGGRGLLCGREPYVINSFMHDELVMGNGGDIIRYIDNIPAGDSVVLFNIGDAGYNNWPAPAKTKLGELGISTSQINDLQPGEPIIIFARKGAAPGKAKIVKSAGVPVNEQQLKTNATVTGRSTSGTMTSRSIGPAQRWDNFFVNVDEAEPNDEVLFDITGIKINGDQELLKSNLSDDADLSGIDAATYPYLKVSVTSTDNIFLTSAQLNKWLVTFQPVAEGLLLYEGQQQPESLYEGQYWTGHYSFVNISDQAFGDSLTVQGRIFNSQTFNSIRGVKRIKPPSPGDTTKFDITFPTEGLSPANDVEVFANPRIISEQNFDNNIIVLSDHINIIDDRAAPVLDVTFDGRHIAKDEFVSADPSIQLSLWDENPYLLKRDTIGVKILLSIPCREDTCELKRIFFSDPTISWLPATDTSEFIVHFKPQTLDNGRYLLHIEANDANGNSSGATPYQITFQVKNETTISISSPYPNPFKYKANFEVTITGQAIPERFSLDIVSINGDLVHRFTEADVTLHIGTNIISWTGLDTNGNSLPGGVYIYRLSIKADNKFLQKAGKLVLVR